MIVACIVVAAGTWWASSVLARRLVLRRTAVAPLRPDDLPFVVDLLELDLRAGATVARAVEFVGEWGPVSWSPVFDAVLRAHADGAPFGEALDVAASAEPAFRSLAAILRSASQSGAGVGALLATVADGARAESRRRAEVRARRLPVLLLFPLVGCFLPAFVCLAITPALLGAVEQLRP